MDDRPHSDSTTETGHVTEQRLGPYRVLEEIGGGGMGVVYLVDTADGPAALKVLTAAWNTPATLRRFRKEAEALRRLDHPGFVRYLDHGDMLETDQGPRPFLLMEYVRGRSLREHISPGGLPLNDVVRMTQDLCDALEHAHGHGVIHRDLKPENVIVEEDTGKLRILDLGIARLPENWTTTVDRSTRSGELLGTIRYMSPEQARGQVDRIGPSSDVYSLGVVVYEMLTGRLPYDVRDETLHELLAAILTDAPVSMRQRRPALAGTLDAVLLTALAKDPGDRPASVGQFARELEAAQRGGTRHRIGAAWRNLRKRKTPWRTAGLVTVLAGVLAWTALQGRNDSKQTDLSSVYRRLQTALELVHFGDRTPERLRAAIDSLSSAREDAWEMEIPWKAPLLRYISIRLGEAGYLLGMSEEDLDRLRWASVRYQEAMDTRSTLEERDAIPEHAPIRADILSHGAHVPYGGHAMTHEALALFDLPHRYLTLGEKSAFSGSALVLGEHTSAIWEGPPFDEAVTGRHRRIAQAIMWNDHAGILSELATISDSLECLERALRIFAAADTLTDLRGNRPAYASFLHQYGVALRRWGERKQLPHELEHAEDRLEAALEIRLGNSGPGLLTRSELARVKLARYELGTSSVDSGLAEASREMDRIWSAVAERPDGLIRARVATHRSRIAAALASGGSRAAATVADSLLGVLLADARIQRLPRARAELYLERGRVLKSLAGNSTRSLARADAYLDSSTQVISSTQYRSLAREADAIRAR